MRERQCRAPYWIYHEFVPLMLYVINIFKCGVSVAPMMVAVCFPIHQQQQFGGKLKTYCNVYDVHINKITLVIYRNHTDYGNVINCLYSIGCYPLAKEAFICFVIAEGADMCRTEIIQNKYIHRCISGQWPYMQYCRYFPYSDLMVMLLLLS